MQPDPVVPLEGRFFTLSLDMLAIADFAGSFVRLNPAWETTLGFTRDELRARPLFDFVHPDDRTRTLEQNRRVREGGHAVSFENRYLCKDGSYRWLLWNSTADLDRQLIYAVARDITARKAAEAERERLLSDLRTALSEVRELQKILPICMYCKNIRDDANYWQTVESYISTHTDTLFSHGICPPCYEKITGVDDTGDSKPGR